MCVLPKGILLFPLLHLLSSQVLGLTLVESSCHVCRLLPICSENKPRIIWTIFPYNPGRFEDVPTSPLCLSVPCHICTYVRATWCIHVQGTSRFYSSSSSSSSSKNSFWASRCCCCRCKKQLGQASDSYVWEHRCFQTQKKKRYPPILAMYYLDRASSQPPYDTRERERERERYSRYSPKRTFFGFFKNVLDEKWRKSNHRVDWFECLQKTYPGL